MLSGNYLGAWPLVISDIEGDSDMDILSGGDLLNGLGNESPLSVWENKLLTTSVGRSYNDNNNTINIWPQPASDRVTFSYNLVQDSYVSLAIYNLQGLKVRELVSEIQPGGNHQTDLNLSIANGDISPGLYVCRLLANNTVVTRKIVIVDN